MKYCSFCDENIEENDNNEKFCMIITKKGKNITEFKCFHFECWKRFFEDAVKSGIREKMKGMKVIEVGER